MAAHPNFEINGNGHAKPWVQDKVKMRTAAGVAGFIIGSILTLFLVKKAIKK